MGKINLSGFSNIHVAKMKTADAPGVRPTYDVPVALRGGKNIEVSLNFEGITFYADNSVSFQDNFFSGGEVTLSLSGLTVEEYVMLFGNKKDEKGVLSVNANHVAPELAITFEKKILGTESAVRRFVLYAVKLAPGSISAETIADSISEEPVELTGVVRQLSDGEIYAMVDTNDDDYDVSLDNWHEEIKFITA